MVPLQIQYIQSLRAKVASDAVWDCIGQNLVILYLSTPVCCSIDIQVYHMYVSCMCTLYTYVPVYDIYIYIICLFYSHITVYCVCIYIYIHTHVSYACYNMCIEIYVSYTCTHMFVYRSGTFQLALHRSESSGKFMWTRWSCDTDGFRNISVWCHDLLDTWNEQIQEVQIRKSSTAFKKACPGLVSPSPCHNCHKAGHPFSSPSCHNHLKMLRFRKRCFWYLSSWFWGRQFQRLW